MSRWEKGTLNINLNITRLRHRATVTGPVASAAAQVSVLADVLSSGRPACLCVDVDPLLVGSGAGMPAVSASSAGERFLGEAEEASWGESAAEWLGLGQ